MKSEEKRSVKIGMISDIHDNIWKLEKALHRLESCQTLLCCGDLCSPFIIDRLGKGFPGPIHIVFGNNDADRYRITLRSLDYPHLHLEGEFAALELGGRSIALHHFDDVGVVLARSGVYDVVCFGHNHRHQLERCGPCWLINPGEVMGGLSARQESTVVIYDTEEDQPRLVRL